MRVASLLWSQYLLNISLSALVAYEYLITFGQEVSTIWKRPWTAASALLLLIRWTMVLRQIMLWANVSR